MVSNYKKAKDQNLKPQSATKNELDSSKPKKNADNEKIITPLELLKKHIDLITTKNDKSSPTHSPRSKQGTKENVVHNELVEAKHWKNLSKRVPFVIPWEMLCSKNTLDEISLNEFNVYQDEEKSKKQTPQKCNDLLATENEVHLKEIMSDEEYRKFSEKVQKIIGPISVRAPSVKKPKIPYADLHEENNGIKKNEVIIVHEQPIDDDNWALVPYTGGGGGDDDDNENDERLEGGTCNDPNCCPLIRHQSTKPDLLPLTKLFPTEPKRCNMPTFADRAYIKRMPIRECMHTKKENAQITNTLGTPVGIIRSTIEITEFDPSDQISRFASYLKAMALIYLKEIYYWKPKDLDRLIDEGEDLLQKETLDPEEEIHKEVYSELESRVLRNFVFEQYKFTIELEFGDWRSNIKESLHDELKKFFIHQEYCLIQIQHWYLLIWKERSKYFVLDLNGRERNSLISNSTAPNAKNVLVLLCLKDLVNVVHLIVNMSRVRAREKFLIRRILYAGVVSPKGRTMMVEFGVRTPEFQMINDNYSYLLSNLHLTLNPAVPVRNRSALPVGIAAMIASKIDHPATWNMKMLDHIICFGVNLCRSCWHPCVTLNEPINLSTFPTCMHMGQFLISFELQSNAFEGTWLCRPIALLTNFRANIQLAFSRHDYLLFQINNQMYAMWKKNDFYYLLDPYMHYISGKLDAQGENLDYTKSASLRMFRDLDILIKVFNDILLQSNRTSKFHIHTLKINSMIKCHECKDPVLMPVAEDDVKSLNEYICFEEDYTVCLEELGQPTDYEEDVDSYMSPIESVTTSLTEIEEEEGDSDLDGYTTASSGHGRRRGWGSSRGNERSGESETNVSTDTRRGKSKASKTNEGDGDGKDKGEEEGEGKDGDGDGKDGDGEDADKKDDDEKDDDGKDRKSSRAKSTTKAGSKSGGGKSGSKSGEGATQLKGLAKESSEYVPKKVKKRCTSSSDEFDKPVPFMSSPCYSKHSKNLIIARSCSGTYESICNKLNAGLRCCDRVLIMTPVGNFVVFRGHDYMEDIFFVYDGCTCHIERFRHLDLSCGTVGLMPFNSLHCVICYMLGKERLYPRCNISAHCDMTTDICNFCTPCQNYC